MEGFTETLGFEQNRARNRALIWMDGRGGSAGGSKLARNLRKIMMIFFINDFAGR